MKLFPRNEEFRRQPGQSRPCTVAAINWNQVSTTRRNRTDNITQLQRLFLWQQVEGCQAKWYEISFIKVNSMHVGKCVYSFDLKRLYNRKKLGCWTFRLDITWLNLSYVHWRVWIQTTVWHPTYFDIEIRVILNNSIFVEERVYVRGGLKLRDRINMDRLRTCIIQNDTLVTQMYVKKILYPDVEFYVAVIDAYFLLTYGDGRFHTVPTENILETVAIWWSGLHDLLT